MFINELVIKTLLYVNILLNAFCFGMMLLLVNKVVYRFSYVRDIADSAILP